ncbi:hypothetical protein ZHAS_00015615 [Anopheles sinensis]|uniref:Uncharacterized protein n=1 Tax=Anopheles sinensis TaxID=74873 RepID=A0A084WAT3_ANOSI|nr:hypothetical protein ZHAS_00015615 [Anopheles sinensis]
MAIAAGLGLTALDRLINRITVDHKFGPISQNVPFGLSATRRASSLVRIGVRLPYGASEWKLQLSPRTPGVRELAGIYGRYIGGIHLM